jgi:hypothetical protein
MISESRQIPKKNISVIVIESSRLYQSKLFLTKIVYLLFLMVYENIVSKRKFSSYSSPDDKTLSANFQIVGNKGILAIQGKALMHTFSLHNSKA